MGIQGLIPFCEQATRPTTISEMRGKTVAVDSYCYLHKGSYSCADKLVKNIKTRAHIDYCVKYVKMLLSCNITPIMVFDGRALPAKAKTEGKRRQGRTLAKDKAKEYLRAGKTEEAKKEFTKAVDITHEHANELMKECRKIGVDSITAMYEADSELAYLNKIGLAEFIISEDSDLILFGCNKIIFKLQLDGRCLLFESEKLYMTINTTEEKFSFDKFRQICILSGCDYLDNLPGIGLSKARKFIMMTEETDMKRALLKLPSYLNMKKLEVSDEYIDDFLKAEATFKFMYVYNPLKREMLRLNPIDESDPMLEYCGNAGKLLEPTLAYQLALGNLNPRTLERVDNFNPDAFVTVANKNKKTPSIWKKTSFFEATKSSRQQSNISNFFKSRTEKHNQLLEVQNIMEQENHVTSDVEIDDLVSAYCVTEVSSSKRRNTQLGTDDEAENELNNSKSGTPSRNPFAKRHQIELKRSAEKPSLLNSLSSKEFKDAFEKVADDHSNHRIVSRFFMGKSETHCQVGGILDSSTEEDKTELSSTSLLLQERQLKHEKFYEVMNSQKCEAEIEINEGDDNLNVDSQLTQNETQEVLSYKEDSDFIDLDQYQCKVKSQKQSFINDIKPKVIIKPARIKGRGPGLFKTKAASSQKSDNSSIQTKLSKFGFQKKPTLT